MSTEKISNWDKAIEDARAGIKRLETAIATCEEMKAAGEPWPTDPPASTQN